jgi:uncharacterized protein (UPF0261 family)
MKTILILSTLDTKGTETLYLRDKIMELGKKPVILDISIPYAAEKSAGSVKDIKADIPPDMVALAGGSTFADLLVSNERAKKTAIITKGASNIAHNMWDEGKVDGVIGIGGSTGSLMATDVMRALPFGVPKVMISSTAALPGMSTRYIDTGDIALVHSVVEISGLSDILKNVIDRSVYAICGMADVPSLGVKKSNEKGRSIALTMLGPCEKCASAVRTSLEAKGYQVIGFSAAGIGDRAMENMIAQGFFAGVIDLAPGAVIEHLVGGMRDAGPDRMEAAGKAGISQIVSVCGVNHITPPKSKYNDDLKSRRKYDLDKFRSWLRASPDELKRAADAFCEKLNKSKVPVKVMIPLKGWSSVDIPGNLTYDPAEDQVFVNGLKNGLNSIHEVIEIDANMEDPKFADDVAKMGLTMFR